MSRVLNVLSHFIHLAKRAKHQIQRGKTASAKRILRKLGRVEERALRYVREESGSDDLERKVTDVVRKTQQARKEINNWNHDEIAETLNEIIALGAENINAIEAREGLARKELATVDRYIRELVKKLNKLSFIKKTKYSCSGHFPRYTIAEPYIGIEYDWKSKTAHNIGAFHRNLLNIVAHTGILKPRPGRQRRADYIRVYHDIAGAKVVFYYLGFPIVRIAGEHEYKQRIANQWNRISRLVKKFADNETLEHRRQTPLGADQVELGEPRNVHPISEPCPRCGRKKPPWKRCSACGN